MDACRSQFNGERVFVVTARVVLGRVLGVADDKYAAPYRVLSLDGGGTWAVIQVMTLIDLFGPDTCGHEVLAKFDLAVANSGGSVILACLALNQPLSKVLLLYTDETERRSTFQPTLVEWLVAKIGCEKLPYPRYSTDKKRAALRKYLPGADTSLSQWRADNPKLADLVITAFDYDVERATFFRTNGDSLAGSRSASDLPDVSLLDAVDSSTDAPVLFFDEPARVELKDGGRRRYWDGAIAGYNNPTMVSVVEALANGEAPGPWCAPTESDRDSRGKPFRRIQVLSLGNGTVHRPRRPAGVGPDDPRFMGGEPSGGLRDFQKLAGAIVDDPPDAASFVAHVTLGGQLPRNGNSVVNGPIVRMNPVVRPVSDGQRWAWPSGMGDPNSPEVRNDWVRLANLGMDSLAQEDMHLIMRFCRAWLDGGVPNQPIRSRDDTLNAEIGHDTYGMAKVAAFKAFEWLPQASASVDPERPSDV